MSKWISVKDKMPKKGKLVIVRILDEPEWKGAGYSQSFDLGYRTARYDHLSGWDTMHDLSKYRNITHWHKMPKDLPPLPIED